MRRIFNRLYDEDPYLDAPLADVEVDMQGWGSTHFFFRGIIEHLKPSLIVEVGSWKGRSALHMADLCKAAGIKNLEICCVDTWLGTSGIWARKGQVEEELKLKNGWPMLYFTFMKNVVEAGHQDVITPLPLPSDMGAQVLKRIRARPDLIYIDAAHDYDNCLRDLRNYFELLDDNGILLGDDYETIDGVTEAAQEFAREKELILVGTRSKFVLSKNVEHVHAMQALLAEIDARRARVAEAKARAAEEASAGEADGEEA
ncbi:class I SAM-dependent methyltransferase [Tropicimonas sediminicola]|uniref:Methyltransferase domain-containing protein n=1 Tax=Tropicimonas sediminicola TaxID=1031541 RepID=A0A239D883_9RHOB|nr:class I SAM-dependent methyltransferase [Tropicimonas sediminicola]SNS28716.1 Methyltransferase domain-containing protein [Tropicimonas sediminicola]